MSQLITHSLTLPTHSPTHSLTRSLLLSLPAQRIREEFVKPSTRAAEMPTAEGDKDKAVPVEDEGVSQQHRD